MIELAPGHKQGLPVENPILVAGGMVGYGEAVPPGLTLSQVGAVVVGPFRANSAAGSGPPRYAETTGGFVLATGGQSRGVAAASSKYSRLWPRLGCPVVAQVLGDGVEEMNSVCGRLNGMNGLSGFELVPLTGELDAAARMVRAVAEGSDLPVWVKVPLAQPMMDVGAWASALVAAGASGLVVGQPTRGMLARSGQQNEVKLVRGELYGPLSFGLMIETLAAVARLALPVALIACGGVHSWEQVQQTLAMGALAVQVDSAVWVEPALPVWLAQRWQAGQGELMQRHERA